MCHNEQILTSSTFSTKRRKIMTWTSTESRLQQRRTKRWSFRQVHHSLEKYFGRRSWVKNEKFENFRRLESHHASPMISCQTTEQRQFSTVHLYITIRSRRPGIWLSLVSMRCVMTSKCHEFYNSTHWGKWLNFLLLFFP